jgi:hypothetical protein
MLYSIVTVVLYPPCVSLTFLVSISNNVNEGTPCEQFFSCHHENKLHFDQMMMIIVFTLY